MVPEISHDIRYFVPARILVEASAPPVVRPVINPVQRILDQLAAAKFSHLGLVVRYVEIEDYTQLDQWWKQHHAGAGALPKAVLPPLGVVVEDEFGPAFAVWCYEVYGVGMAFLEYAVSRPGISMRLVSNAGALAVLSIMEQAGKNIDPPAQFSVFSVSTKAGIARVLKRLGFVGEHECINMIYRKEEN